MSDFGFVYTVTFADMTLGQGQDRPSGHGEQLHNLLSRSNLTMRSCGRDADFQYVCTVKIYL